MDSSAHINVDVQVAISKLVMKSIGDIRNSINRCATFKFDIDDLPHDVFLHFLRHAPTHIGLFSIAIRKIIEDTTQSTSTAFFHNRTFEMPTDLKMDISQRCRSLSNFNVLFYSTAALLETPHIELRYPAKLIGQFIKFNASIYAIDNSTIINEVITVFGCDYGHLYAFKAIYDPTCPHISSTTGQICNSVLHALTTKFKGYKVIRVITSLQNETPIKVFIPDCLLNFDSTSLQQGVDVVITGVCMPIAAKNNNLYDFQIDAHDIQFDTTRIECTDESLIQKFAIPDLYTVLANAIAPAIDGYLDIKKSILLQMIGSDDDNSTIHILLSGDAAMGKSTFLKSIHLFRTRVSYITGIGTTHAGLIGCVTPNGKNGHIIECGALAISDKSILLIDNIEQLDESALLESMSIGTVSIAKADINAVFQARTSILATTQNHKLGKHKFSHAFENRFDLIWNFVDTYDQDGDRRLTDYITRLHRFGCSTPPIFDIKEIKYYIHLCRIIKKIQVKTVDEKISAYLSHWYVNIRKDARLQKNLNPRNMTNARSLKSIFKLADAHARLHLRNVILMEDIVEATRLFELSLTHTIKPRVTTIEIENIVYNIIIANMMSKNNKQEAAISNINEECQRYGIPDATVREVICTYEQLNVFKLNASETYISLVNHESLKI
jgi:hypothetical protein